MKKVKEYGKRSFAIVLSWFLIFGQLQPIGATTISQNDAVLSEQSASVSSEENDAGLSEQASVSEAAEQESATTVLYSGTDGGIHWSIDSTGHLLITGTGNFQCNTKVDSSFYPQWSAYWEDIVTASVQVSDITNTEFMFGYCKNLKRVDLSGLDASKVTSMYGMFMGCLSLTDIHFGNIDTRNVKDMRLMFSWCTELKCVDLSSFQAANPEKISSMFNRCYSLESVDLSMLDFSNISQGTDPSDPLEMFEECDKLVQIQVPSKMGDIVIALPVKYRIDTYHATEEEKWNAYQKGVDQGIVTTISKEQAGMILARVDGASRPEGVYAVKVTGAKDSYLELVSGSETQNYVETAMETVVYQAEEGYCIPEDYIAGISGLTNGAANGVTVVRNSDSKLTISGTPTADVEICLVPATKLPDSPVVPEKEDTSANYEKQLEEIAQKYDVSKDTLNITEESITNRTSDSDMKGSSFGTLKAKATKNNQTSITLKWSKVKGADGYIVYGNRCNTTSKKYKCKRMKTLSANKTSYTAKKLKKGQYYKFIVRAYKNVNGKKVTIASSVTIHSITKGGKYGVAKSVKIEKIGSKKNTTKITLKKGKTATIKAKEIKESKPIKRHRKLVYESSNKKVATVSKSGKIKAKGKGKCKIYVYAQNGVYKTVTVTVK